MALLFLFNLFFRLQKTAGEWRVAFTIYAVSFLISAISFTLLARGETEPWARDDVQDEQLASDYEADKELMEMNAKNSNI